MTAKLSLVPLDLAEAYRFIEKWHRHHIPPQGGKVAIGAIIGDEVVGVAVLARPVARRLDNGWTVELTRLATNGQYNACSFLLSKARRLATAMGYRSLITYTLASESGASLRAAGYRMVALSPGGSWSTKSRPRVDKHPLQEKLKWEVSL